jgi:hypothetical protein
MVWWVAAATFVCACGRIGFDAGRVVTSADAPTTSLELLFVPTANAIQVFTLATTGLPALVGTYPHATLTVIHP